MDQRRPLKFPKPFCTINPINLFSLLSYFDHWGFPVGRIIGVTLILGWAVAAGIALRRSAEYARETALGQIAELLTNRRDSELSEAQSENSLF